MPVLQTHAHVGVRDFRELPAMMGWMRRRPESRMWPSGPTNVREAHWAQPNYPRDIKAYPNVIMHVGVGGFHRSHQAYYMDELLRRKGQQAGWASCGVGLMPGDAAMADALRSQDNLYTLLSQGPKESKTTVVGSIMDFVLVPDDPAAAVERMADPAVKIVSLTVTEKGYCLDVNGDLDAANPLVQAELPVDAPPHTVLGLMYGALKLRVARGVPVFTVLSCDNLPGNGTITAHAFRGFVEAKADVGDPMAAQIARLVNQGELAFPSTMVDRITPATEQAHRELLESEHGIKDAWPVVCEDFTQWVIEDNFPQGRPAWEEVGVIMTPSDRVHAYESMKLRLLNGTHSAMAYVSYLCGHREVAMAMSDPAVRGFVSAFIDEVMPTVSKAPGVDLHQYRNSLLDRFSNTHIKDSLLRLAEDGSMKLQTTMKPVIREQIHNDKSFNVMAVAIAGWIRFMTGKDHAGAVIEGIKDPQGGDTLRQLATEAVNDPSTRTTACLLRQYFGDEIAENPVACQAVGQAIVDINEMGTKAVLQRYVAQAR